MGGTQRCSEWLLALLRVHFRWGRGLYELPDGARGDCMQDCMASRVPGPTDGPGRAGPSARSRALRLPEVAARLRL